VVAWLIPDFDQEIPVGRPFDRKFTLPFVCDDILTDCLAGRAHESIILSLLVPVWIRLR
jgi:hypothetical protein